MQHDIPAKDGDPARGQMAQAISACVHCGFCLPACPTYHLTGQETESPRGRILLMKNALEGATSVEQAAPHVDRCLGCLSCVPACPSGVAYGSLLNQYRSWSEPQRRRRRGHSTARRMLLRSLSSPRRAARAIRAARFARPVAFLLPPILRSALELLPKSGGRVKALPEVTPVNGKRRAKVALLAGCVQQVVAQDINLATIEVLSDNGIEVVVSKQSCCGALAGHAGELAEARRLARLNFKSFPQDVDAIITNAAGCGSAIAEYSEWFAGSTQSSEASEFSRRTVDVSVFLDQLGLVQRYGWSSKKRLVYQDACHLLNGQGVHQPPRRLLAQIDGLTIVESAAVAHCCGSAGIYNLEQPETAQALGSQLAQSMIDCGADLVCSGNVGCIIQLRKHLTARSPGTEVVHIMQVLQRARKRS